MSVYQESGTEFSRGKARRMSIRSMQGTPDSRRSFEDEEDREDKEDDNERRRERRGKNRKEKPHVYGSLSDHLVLHIFFCSIFRMWCWALHIH